MTNDSCCCDMLGPKVPHYAQTFRAPSATVRGSPPVAVDDESFTFHKSAESESHVNVMQRKMQSASKAVSYLQRCFEYANCKYSTSTHCRRTSAHVASRGTSTPAESTSTLTITTSTINCYLNTIDITKYHDTSLFIYLRFAPFSSFHLLMPLLFLYSFVCI